LTLGIIKEMVACTAGGVHGSYRRLRRESAG